MKEILLNDNQILIMDDEDFETAKAYKWRAAKSDNGKYYAQTLISGRYVSYSTIIFSMQKGNRIIYKNGNSLDMRRENIQICNKDEYYYLIPKKNKSSTSQYHGVYYKADDKKWVVQISIDGKRYARSFDLEEEAAIVSDYYALKKYGPVAKLNFPELSQQQLETKYCEVLKQYEKKPLNEYVESPDGGVIKLSGGYELLVDKADFEVAKLYKWYKPKKSNGYYCVQTQIDTKLVCFGKVVFSLENNQAIFH